MAKIKLASQSLNTSGMSGGLRPIQLSTRAAAGNVQAPFLNPGVANIRYTPHNIPEIVVDNTLTEVGKLSQVWADAAMKFQMRESQAKADQRLLNLEGELNKIYYGDGDTVGYGLSEHQVAVEGYEVFDSTVKQTVANYIQDSEPNVRARMVEKAIAMQTKFLNSGATHKAKQLKSWQEQLSQAEYESVVREIIVASEEDPAKFLETIAYRELELQEEFQGNDALIAMKTQAFRDNIFDKTIDYHLKKGNTQLAEFYLDRAYEAEADPTVLANAEDKIITVLTKEADDELESIKRQNDLIKEQNEAQKNRALKIFRETGNLAALDLIDDVQLRTAVKDAAQKEREGYSDPEAEALMHLQRRELAKNPDIILMAPEFANVSLTKKLAFHDKLTADNKSGVSGVKNLALEWAEALLPQKNELTGTFQQEEMAGLMQRMAEYIEGKADDAQASGKVVTIAIEEAKQDILKWPEFSLESYAAINEARVTRIHDLPGGQDLMYEYKYTDNLQTGDFSEAIGRVATRLKAKYGLTPEENFRDATVLAKMATDPGMRMQYMRDLTAFEMQVAFIRKQASEPKQPATKTSNSAASPQATSNPSFTAPSSQNGIQ